MKKVWIVYVSCGAGHKKAAEAVYEAFQGDENACLFDLMGFAPGVTKFLYEQGYRIMITQFPFLWKVMFILSKSRLIRKCILFGHLYRFRIFIKRLIVDNPRVIITTHFFIAHMVSYLKRKGLIQSKLVTVVTDFGVHPLWVNGYTDRYIVAADCVKDELMSKFRMNPECIEVFGIPLRKEFYTANPDDFKDKYCKPGNFTLFLFSSALGVGPFKRVIEMFFKVCCMFIIYGRNKRIKTLIDKLAKPLYVKGFEYKEEVWELMSLSDLVITKAGGISVSECIAMKKPLIIIHAIYGQEDFNTRFILNKGLGFYPKNTRELLDILKRLIESPQELQRVKDNLNSRTVVNSPKKIRELVISSYLTGRA